MRPIHYVMLTLSALQAILIAETQFFPEYGHTASAIAAALTVVLATLGQISPSASSSPMKDLKASMPTDSAVVVKSETAPAAEVKS